jgi:hypothetical protein
MDTTGLDRQVTLVRRLHFYGGLNMLFFWFLMAIAYGAAKQFRVFQLPTYILGTSFGPAAIPIFAFVGRVNTSVLVASFVLLTWVFHHIEALWAERVVAWIRNGAQWLRWVEYSFSASIMLLAISLTSGVMDVATLLVTFATYNACMVFGGISEWHLSVRGHDGKKQAMAFYILSCIMFVAAWVPTFIAFFLTASNLASGESVPGFVYVIIFLIFALQFPFIIIFSVKMGHMWNMRTTAAEFLAAHGYKYELWYIYMSFAAKTALSWTVFGAAFQQSDVSALPEPTNPYSEWVLSAFLVGGFMWCVSALTYLLDQGKNPFNVLGDSEGLHSGYRAAFRVLAPLTAALRIVTICIAITYQLDFQDKAWISGLALGVHLGCEALFIPAADTLINAANPTAHQRRLVFVIRVASFIAYAAFVIVAMITATFQPARIIFIVFGIIVLLHMFIVEVVLHPRQLVSDASNNTGGIQK